MKFCSTTLSAIIAAMLLAGCEPVEKSQGETPVASSAPTTQSDRVVKSNEQWKRELSAKQYYILREKGTEPAYNNEFHDNKEPGMYQCAGCGIELYSSDHKFDSGTGWPSFYQAVADGRVRIGKDQDGERDELTCARCDGHLGHIFDDGPKPTGKRHCINSASMKFVAAK